MGLGGGLLPTLIYWEKAANPLSGPKKPVFDYLHPASIGRGAKASFYAIRQALPLEWSMKFNPYCCASFRFLCSRALGDILNKFRAFFHRSAIEGRTARSFV
jgi:hypothetical protein